jgi:dTDP-4-dehydrorhamnose reductase
LNADRGAAGEPDGNGARERDRELRVLVVGAAGQLGQVLAPLAAQSWTVTAWTRAELEVTDGRRVARAVQDLEPWAVVNCAAYNEVDLAEEQPVAALEANAFAVRSLARAARSVDATFVTYSTDFVFDGEAARPYREDDRPNPRSVYAASKLLGEWFAADAESHYVLRVESLFGGLGRRKGSLDKIIESVASGRTVRAFTDRTVSPSYVWDVADATMALLRSRPEPGVYHCVNGGAMTWFEIATELKRQFRSESPLEAITMSGASLRAPRPNYCALSNDKLRAAGVRMPTFQDALTREVRARTPTTDTTDTTDTGSKENA